MKIDMYGSRQHLMFLLNNRPTLNIQISQAYIGTSLDSQSRKAIKLDEQLIRKNLNDYEALEVFIDSRKVLRATHKISQSNVVFVDFLNEGRPLININGGTLVDFPTLKKCIPNYEESKKQGFAEKYNKIAVSINSFHEFLKTYDLVILNKLRIPKLQKSDYGYTLKPNLQQINFENAYIETLEDLLLEKVNNIKVVEAYDRPSKLVDNYYYDQKFVNYLQNEISEILHQYELF